MQSDLKSVVCHAVWVSALKRDLDDVRLGLARRDSARWQRETHVKKVLIENLCSFGQDRIDFFGRAWGVYRPPIFFAALARALAPRALPSRASPLAPRLARGVACVAQWLLCDTITLLG